MAFKIKGENFVKETFLCLVMEVYQHFEAPKFCVMSQINGRAGSITNQN
jgi:hypothetical protein